MLSPGLACPIREILFDGSPYRVLDAQGFRRLMLRDNPDAALSTMALAAPDVLVTPHEIAMMCVLPLAPATQDIVLVGMGGGQQAKFLRQRLPYAFLTALESEAKIIDIAQRYFSVPRDDPQFHVVHADGRDYLRMHRASCDLILCDAYDAQCNVPESLSSAAFYHACFLALRQGGVMALHIDRRASRWNTQHLRLISEIFPEHMELPVQNYQSVLLLARDGFDIAHDELMRRAIELEGFLELELPAFITLFEKVRARQRDAQYETHTVAAENTATGTHHHHDATVTDLSASHPFPNRDPH